MMKLYLQQIYRRWKNASVGLLGRVTLCNVTKNEIISSHLQNPRKGLSIKKKRSIFHRKLPGNENQSWEDRLADAVTPFWYLSYEKQLQLKQIQQHKILLEMSNLLVKEGTSRASVSLAKEDLSFPLMPIKSSPVRYGYRNKSTFSVNVGVDGNPKTVGFYLGSGKNKNIVCINGNHLLNIPVKHKMVAKCYEEFIRLSPLDPCILFHEGGHWREITVRTNSVGDTMAIVYFHPQRLTKEEIGFHKTALLDYFTNGPGAVCALVSLYFQETTMTRCSNEDSPYQLLYGKSHIYEEVLGSKFRISADAFFQVNTEAAEVLYHTVRELCLAKEEDTVLDVCCGTGVIGIILSSKVKKVIGIEVIEQAVKDANHNASLNGVLNCEFLAGKAEVILPQLMPSLRSEASVTAVVNPSRAGLHHRVVRALRNSPAVRRLIYISCKPRGEAMRNFKELCCPLPGEPFRPTVAIPVDMFPHTTHCELVLVFER